MTWKGAEFVETVRDRDIWERTKGIAKKVGASSPEMLMQIASRLLQDKLLSVLT